MSFFDRLPTPVLILLLGGASFLFLVDLFLPDPVPLLEELLLLYTVFGTGSALSRRVKAQLGGPPLAAGQLRDGESERRPYISPLSRRQRELALASLPGRCTTLLSRAQHLEASDGLGPSTRPLELLVARVVAMNQERMTLSSLFSKKQHRPGRMRRKIEELEAKLGRLGATGSGAKLERLRSELTDLQGQELDLREKARRLDELTDHLVLLDGQVREATEELDQMLAEGLVAGTFGIRSRESLAPELDEFFARLHDFADAEAEIDARLTS